MIEWPGKFIGMLIRGPGVFTKKKTRQKERMTNWRLLLITYGKKCHKRYCLYVLGMEYTELLGKLARLSYSIGYRVNEAWSITYLYHWVN